MARTEKYFVGPRLLEQIRGVVERVGGQPYSASYNPRAPVLQDIPRAGDGGGLLLGQVTGAGAWLKDTIRDVTVYDAGSPLNEAPSSPTPRVIQGCINKMVTASQDSFVIIGNISGRWYLVSAECV